MSFTYTLNSLRFGEFDLGGVLYHANYFHIYEMVREAFLQEGPTSYTDLVAAKSHLAVVETRQRFLQPIYYGEKIKVEMIISEVQRASATFEYKISDEHVVHLGLTRLVFVKSDDAKFAVTPLPPDLRAYFERFVSKGYFNE